jgi:hypothetical protein
VSGLFTFLKHLWNLRVTAPTDREVRRRERQDHGLDFRPDDFRNAGRILVTGGRFLLNDPKEKEKSSRRDITGAVGDFCLWIKCAEIAVVDGLILRRHSEREFLGPNKQS